MNKDVYWKICGRCNGRCVVVEPEAGGAFREALLELASLEAGPDGRSAALACGLKSD